MPKSIPPDKIRISGSKVRTGCRTCKARRIKCDEGRPTCRKCLISRRKCEGYEILPQSFEGNQGYKFVHYVEAGAATALVPPTDYVAPSMSRDLRHPTNLDRLALRSLDFYINSATIQLGGPARVSTFSTGLSRLMYSDAAVRHCLVALAAFQESLISDDRAALRQQRRELAVHHYNKSIKAVLDMSQFNPDHAAVVTTTTCLLYCAIEIVQGHFTSAIKQIEAGLRLLAQNEAALRQQEKTHLGVVTGYVDALKCLFLGLGAQARELQDAELDSTELSTIHALGADPIITYDFVNTEQALSSLARFEDNMLMLMGWIGMECNDATFPSDDLRRSKQRLDLQLSLRAEAYCRLEEKHSAHTDERSQQDPVSLLILRIHQITNKIDLAMAFEAREMVFDLFVKDFAEVVELSKQVLNLEVDRKPTSPNQIERDGSQTAAFPTFTLSIGVIPSLFFTCARCRDPTVRRKALRLLQDAQRRESVWDSRIVAIVAARLIQIEEAAAKRYWVENSWYMETSDVVIEQAQNIPEVVRLCEIQVQCGATPEYAQHFLHEQIRSNPDENYLVWNAETPGDCFVLSRNPIFSSATNVS